jgi:hypothetical protein
LVGEIFPDVIGSLISPTRQEAYFLGTPPGDQRFNEGNLPIWVALGKRAIYGIPGNERRGVKVGDDTRGEPFDPTDGDRTPTPSLIQIMREELRVRMPDLANAPLLEARACQYEDTPAKSLLIDRHPEAAFRVNHEKVRSTIHRFGKTLRNLWSVGSARLSQAPIHPALHTSLQTPRRRRHPLSRASSGGAPTTLGQPKKSTRSYAVVVVCECNVNQERKT